MVHEETWCPTTSLAPSGGDLTPAHCRGYCTASLGSQYAHGYSLDPTSLAPSGGDITPAQSLPGILHRQSRWYTRAYSLDQLRGRSTWSRPTSTSFCLVKTSQQHPRHTRPARRPRGSAGRSPARNSIRYDLGHLSRWLSTFDAWTVRRHRVPIGTQLWEGGRRQPLARRTGWHSAMLWETATPPGTRRAPYRSRSSRHSRRPGSRRVSTSPTGPTAPAAVQQLFSMFVLSIHFESY